MGVLLPFMGFSGTIDITAAFDPLMVLSSAHLISRCPGKSQALYQETGGLCCAQSGIVKYNGHGFALR
jgi:hypothetical protein